MKPELSIVCPSIRPHLLLKMYESIFKSTTRSFELVVVSPYALPEELNKFKNIKLIRDFGSPMRCNQLGTLFCEGKYLYPTHSDDAIFIENSLDKNLDLITSLGDNIENVVVCKYSESENYSANERFQSDDYYKIVNAYPVNKEYIPKSWYIFNAAIFHKEYFYHLGGWDCIFDVPAMGHADLAIRAQKGGAKVTLSPFPISNVDHMPGTSGDHAPIHYSQILHDTPIFYQKYSGPIDNLQVTIDIMNWKSSETIWLKRFKI